MKKQTISPDDFKTMVVIKLEMLRGACQVDKGPRKKDIAKSIEEFIKKLETYEVVP